MEANQIKVMLHRLELAFKPIHPDRMAIYVETLERKRVTAGQLGDAIYAAIEKCERFPSVAELLRFAQPPTVNAPRRDEGSEDSNLAEIFDREEESLRYFVKKYTDAGDHRKAAEIEYEIEKIHVRRAARGLTSRLRPAVENFDGTPLRTVERDWTEADLINPETGERGYPNAFSKRVSAAKQARIDARFGPNAQPLKPVGNAKPAFWEGGTWSEEKPRKFKQSEHWTTEPEND